MVWKDYDPAGYSLSRFENMAGPVAPSSYRMTENFCCLRHNDETFTCVSLSSHPQSLLDRADIYPSTMTRGHGLYIDQRVL